MSFSTRNSEDRKTLVRKAYSASQLSHMNGNMRRTPSGQLLSFLHQPEQWEQQGAWQTKAPEAKQIQRMERDESMVNLLNLLDPASLVDKKPEPGEIYDEEQHSALSERGVAYLGGASALAWYVLRLILRDGIGVGSGVMELHALSTVHSLGWAAFLAKKIGSPANELPKFCSRALVASLGFYVHDCWMLRGTMLSNPAKLMHQASMVVTVSSILRSKGVAWLAVPIMSQAVPNLLHEMLRFCGTIGLPPVRPEVCGLRLLWFLSFVTSKLGIVPTWLRHRGVAEMHQPNLFSGKLSYLMCFAFDLLSMRSALQNLPRFLRPAGVMLPAVQAYKMPLQGVKAVGTSVVAAMVLGIVFSSYLTAPVALVLAVLGFRSGSSQRTRIGAGILCSVVALDQIVPQSKECWEGTRFFLPLFRQALKVFNFKTYPHGQKFLQDLPKDRHHMIATTPHGLFPWGAGCVIVSCIDAGYLPNFVGASVLGALPVAGRLLRALGFRPAEKKEVLKCLEKEYPRNITILLPGGIREMFQIREDIEISAANLHSGFAELARQGGAMLIPSYAFGVSQLYKVSSGPLADFFEKLSRKLQTSLVLFTGRWGTLLPYPYEMACAMGEPIDTLKCRDGKEVHRLYLDRLRAAFNKHKAAFGWGERELYFEGEEMPPPPVDPLDEYMALPSSSHSKL